MHQQPYCICVSKAYLRGFLQFRKLPLKFLLCRLAAGRPQYNRIISQRENKWRQALESRCVRSRYSNRAVRCGVKIIPVEHSYSVLKWVLKNNINDKVEIFISIGDGFGSLQYLTSHRKIMVEIKGNQV